ncbi:MAG: 50S ribosomal protein L13 [Dehalococcoidia bacterium]|jgi:large subunit ribosomal protein L13|nr:50S ribosomal protein L13 [Dehalococcoidia bacterium]TET55731.1 MAG: 50S ribosomal protein L13 [Dehalococcoidia bacterium]
MKTYSPRAKDIKREWWVIDAADRVLGRMAARAAHILMGKHKPMYAPHMDTGDYVVIVNAAKVRVTGRKAEQKIYYRHSGYPGGLKSPTFKELFSQNPVRVVELAVKGMLPHNSLGRAMFKKLKVYPGNEHRHQAQTSCCRPGAELFTPCHSDLGRREGEEGRGPEDKRNESEMLQKAR